MFENLSERLSGVLDRLTKQGALSEDDVKTALREVRVALLEADVSLPVAREFIKKVQDQATGQAVTKSVTPGQQVVKIVHDALVDTLTGEGDPGALKIDNPPAPILMVGLQGSGKTTTTAKLAKRLKEREGKRVLMASLDVNRPAAMEQLQILGQQIGVDTLPIVKGEDPVTIAKRAKTQAGLGGYDVYMLDTAGRLHIDAELIQQAADVRDVANPRETLLVVDGLCPATHESQWRDFNLKFFQHFFDFVVPQHFIQGIVQRPQIRIDFVVQVSGQKTQALAGFHRRTHQHQASDPVMHVGFDRTGHRQIGFTGTGRTNTKIDVMGDDVVQVLFLIIRTTGDHTGFGFDRHFLGLIIRLAGISSQNHMHDFRTEGLIAGFFDQQLQHLGRLIDIGFRTFDLKVMPSGVDVGMGVLGEQFQVNVLLSVQVNQASIVDVREFHVADAFGWQLFYFIH